MRISRRDMLAAAASLAATRSTARGSDDRAPFGATTVVDRARALARHPWTPPDRKLPQGLGRIGYDAFRGISLKPERALWRGDERGFEMQLFHRGFIYDERIDIHAVADGWARRLAYSPDLFDSTMIDLALIKEDLGFSGLRLHAPIHHPGLTEEFAVFQGASYFRSHGRGQTYGLSARGLALRTAALTGEEFPVFVEFWAERPPHGAHEAVVHALLDSESVTGAFRFAIRPGAMTVMDVAATLFPRVDLPEPGLAPLTSMYYFSPADQAPKDDYRPAVHDSEGLALLTGANERLWRPLSNPRMVRISRFPDENPRGFGLMQRRRAPRDYQDLNARYEARPSLWVEPRGDWGRGHVRLIEFPTENEFADNIVAYWTPETPLRAGMEFSYAYRLHWGAEAPAQGPEARFMDTLSGVGGMARSRFFALNAEGETLRAAREDEIGFSVTATGGEVVLPGLEQNRFTGGRRLAFTIAATGVGPVEIRAQLMAGERPLTETWVYRWDGP